MLPAMLGFVSTGLLTEDVHETNMEEFYAADAGIEDALWQIKADELPVLFPTYDRYAYEEHDGTHYTYSEFPATASAPELNDKDVDVTIENVWIPAMTDIAAPSAEEAQQLIDEGKLVVTGRSLDTNTYLIRLTYNYQEVDDPHPLNLRLDKLAIWLPPGFSYVPGSSNLEQNQYVHYYSVPTTQPYKSGQMVRWDFSPDVLFTDMPGNDVRLPIRCHYHLRLQRTQRPNPPVSAGMGHHYGAVR